MQVEVSPHLKSNLQERIGTDQVVETWITLPRHCRPADWDDKYEEPVVRLEVNLYGHPLAGLHWEIFCSYVLLSEGFQKVP